MGNNWDGKQCDQCGAKWEPGEQGQPVVYHDPNCPQAGSSGRNRTRQQRENN